MNKKTKVSKPLIIIVILTFILTAIATNRFTTVVERELAAIIDNDLTNMIAQQEQIINNENKNNCSDLIMLANTINTIDPQYINNYLASILPISNFSQIYHIKLDGQGISADGQIVDFSQNVPFKQVVSTNKQASALNINSQLDNGIMDLAVPIMQDNVLTGVLLAENIINPVFSQIVDSLDNRGYILIADKNGKELVSSTDNFISYDSIANGQIKFLDNSTLMQIQTDLANMQEGSIRFLADGITYISKYSPLNFGELMLVITLEESIIHPGIREVSDLSTYISLFLMAFFIVASCYIWQSKKNQIKQIEKIAYYDDLTGLPNLTKLKHDVHTILINNPIKKYAIIKVDVVNFKAINEIHGFNTGNRLLQAFKQISSGAPEKSLIVARIGIDEFIFFAGNNFLEQLDDLTAAYESQFKEFVPELSNYHLAFRYGRYFIEPGENDVDDIITKVSLAHTMAKEKTESVIWDYDYAYKQKVLATTAIINKMDMAIANKEFCAYLQPKFNLSDNSLIGAEALVRWIEADGNIIAPNDFIPIFESNGFVIDLDKFILDTICQLLIRWQANGLKAIPISVNFSRLHLANANFVSDIKQIVDKHRLNHNLIEVELTETTILENEQVLKKVINDLHAANFTISIDDFGAGYSSLGLLKEFKMDTIKLDRSFIMYKEENNRGELVIDGIVKLAHSLNMKIVAEGIEKAEQAAFLKSIGCEAAQGYYFAKPMPIIDFEKKFLADMS